MGKGKRAKKAAKPKYRLVEEATKEGEAAYALLAKVRKQWHDHLRDAQIVLAWMIGKKADRDGRLTLGRCLKVGELDRQLCQADLVLVLNQEHWRTFGDEQRTALLDHELCHADVAIDSDMEPKVDGHQRQQFRLRKHDLEEFSAVVRRHGIYKRDLEQFVEALRESKQGDLFAKAQAKAGSAAAAPAN